MPLVKLRLVPNKGDNDELSFEQGIQRLESIVEAMEGGDLPLEAMMQKFEEGTKLAKSCQDKLAQAEVRIQQIETNAGGELTLKPFQATDAND